MKYTSAALFLLTILLFSTGKLIAQDYDNAIGVRLGTENGLSFKTFIDNTNALDFILSFRSNNARKSSKITALYEVHQQIPDALGLGWYYGAGGGVGSVRLRGQEREFLLAIDGVIGLDYKFSNDPINISLDYKPTFEISPNSDLEPQHFGISARFTF